jgi:mono/diheme cytochrome c family protein
MFSPMRFLTPAAAAVFVVTLVASAGAQSPRWLRPVPSHAEGRRDAAWQRPATPRPGPPGQTPTKPPAATGTTSGADPREATARRLCTQCHPFESVIAIRRTRAQWEATVENMVGRGARGTPDELAAVVDFLSDKYALNGTIVRGAAGPDDKPLVDPKAVEIAEPLWTSDCAICHGKDARGTPKGPNLVRSLLVLSDRYGSKIGPYLRSQHPKLPSGKILEPTDTQVLLFAHLLRSRLNDTLRGAPMFKPGNVLVGDAKAGEAYYAGEGKCTECHSASGDLAGIATRISDPVNLQQRFLFPANSGGRRNPSKPAPVTTVTVTPATGPAVTGELVYLDDFNVTLRDADSNPHTFRRTPAVRVDKHDPYAAHVALLDRITDPQIHDVVAYLWTLK